MLLSLRLELKKVGDLSGTPCQDSPRRSSRVRRGVRSDPKGRASRGGRRGPVVILCVWEICRFTCKVYMHIYNVCECVIFIHDCMRINIYMYKFCRFELLMGRPHFRDYTSISTSHMFWYTHPSGVLM